MARLSGVGRKAGLVAVFGGVALLLGGGLAGGDTTDVVPGQVRLFDRGTYYLGVATHLSANRDLGYEPGPVIDALRGIGFNSYRDGIKWMPGAPADGATPAPKVAEVLQSRVGRPLLVLAGDANGPGRAPTDPVRRDAFARFAVQAVGNSIGYSPIYEIWNEWNRSADPKAKPMVTAGLPDDARFSGRYAQTAQDAVGAIKARYPQARVLVGAAATDPNWNWVTDVVQRGGMAAADGLSVHIYNQCNKSARGSDEAVARLRALHDRLTGVRGGAPDLYVTEWGWSTGATCQVDSGFVAANSAQFIFAAAALPYVKGTWQYELKDEAIDPRNLEKNFGVVAVDYQPKAITCAIADSVQLLRSVRAIGTAPAPDGITAIVARTGSELVAMLWDNRPGGRATARFDGAVRAAAVCSDPRQVARGQAIPLGAMPIVVHLGTQAPRFELARG